MMKVTISAWLVILDLVQSIYPHFDKLVGGSLTTVYMSLPTG